MEDLIIITDMIEKLGYNLDNLTFREGVGLKMDIEKVIEQYLDKE